jgi:hypothetical protein
MKYVLPIRLASTFLTVTHIYGANQINEPSEDPIPATTTQCSIEIVGAHTQIAMDPNTDINKRLESARKLPQDSSIRAYKAVLASINKSRTLSVGAKISSLIEAEIDLYKVGDSKTALPLLSEHVTWLLDKINSQDTEVSYVNTYVVVTAAEILFNTGNITKDKTLLLFEWAIKNTNSVSLVTIIHAAERTERLGFLDACKRYLKYFASFTAKKDLKDRADALHANAFTEKANFSTYLKEGIA